MLTIFSLFNSIMWENKINITNLELRLICWYLNLWNRFKNKGGVEEMIQVELFLVRSTTPIFFIFILLFTMFPLFFFSSQHFLNTVFVSLWHSPFSSISINIELLRLDPFQIPFLRSMSSLQTMSHFTNNVFFAHLIELRHNRFEINEQYEATFSCVLSMTFSFQKDSPVIYSSAGGLGINDGMGESWCSLFEP